MIAYVRRIHDIEAVSEPSEVSREAVESNPVRCPDQEAAEKMVERIKELRKEGDSAGGLVELVVSGESVKDNLFDITSRIQLKGSPGLPQPERSHVRPSGLALGVLANVSMRQGPTESLLALVPEYQPAHWQTLHSRVGLLEPSLSQTSERHANR